MQEVLLDLPGLLFFSTYTLLVLFWAEIYHQARSLPTTTLRPMFVAFNALVYAVQVISLHSQVLFACCVGYSASAAEFEMLDLECLIGQLTASVLQLLMLYPEHVEFGRGR